MVAPESIESQRENERGLLRAIRQDAVARLWYLDRQVWSRKGALTRCLSATVRELFALISRHQSELPPTEWSEAVARLHVCLPQWTSAELSWADTVILFDVILVHAIEFLAPEGSASQFWLIHAALNSLKSQVSAGFILIQAEELARYREDGVSSQHLAGRFLANASHELRTPLTAVLGFSELLLEETYGPLTGEQRTAVGHIENSAQNLLEIVSNVLDLMQFRAGRLQLQYRHMAAAPVLMGIFDILKPLSERRKVKFRHEVAEDLGSIEADEGIIRHIVYHLLESALRATPENGEVVLSAERGEGMLTIVTYDTALHFPAEAIENMNDAYPIRENSPARGYEGWEIGLPLVRRYVDLHAGTLAIESTPETGTTIRVHLPTQRAANAGEARRSAERPAER